MSDSEDQVVQQVPVNMDSTRSDLKPLLDKLNPILKQVLDILMDSPDESADCDTNEVPARFSKVLYSRTTKPSPSY